MRKKPNLRYGEIVCAFCGVTAKRPMDSINTAKRLKRVMFCGRSCFGKHRRKTETPEDRAKRLKRIYERSKRHRATLISVRKPFESPFSEELYLNLEEIIKEKYKLTAQEAIAAVQVLRGRERKAAAEDMGLTVSTFEKHKEYAHMKLSVSSGLQCIVKLMPILVRMQDRKAKERRRLAPARKIVKAMERPITDLPIGKMT